MKTLFLTINNRNLLNTEEIIFVTPPLNLMYLAQSLIHEGYDAKILDAYALNLSQKETFHEIRKYDPDVIGVSLYTWDLKVSYDLLKNLKKAFPHVKLILGGHHPSYLPDKTLKEFPFVDALIRGEGEKAIVELIRAYEKEDSLKNVHNASFRHHRKVINNAELPVIHNLDEIPIPSQDLIDTKIYYSKLFKRNPLGVIITSRGCPYRCSFCSRLNEGFRMYRQRSPENVMIELKEIYDAGAKSLDIYDETFTINHKRCTQILHMMKKEGMDMELRVRTRVNTINKQMLHTLAKNNTKIMCYGVESGNQKVLDINNKLIRLETVRKAFKETHDVGMETCGFFIVGLPGDTPETIIDTINFCKEINPTYPSFGKLVPLPKTQVYNPTKEQGRIVGEWSVFKPDPYLKLPWMKSQDDLDYYFKLAFDKTIKRPGFITQTLWRCIKDGNWNQLSYLARNSMKDLRDIKGYKVKKNASN